MEPRLTADFWVRAYLTRLRLASIPAFVTRKGDPSAGAVIIKLNTLDGRAVVHHRSFAPEGGRVWAILFDGPEAEADAMLARQHDRDPDLWTVEVESRDGQNLLEEEGLA